MAIKKGAGYGDQNIKTNTQLVLQNPLSNAQQLSQAGKTGEIPQISQSRSWDLPKVSQGYSTPQSQTVQQPAQQAQQPAASGGYTGGSAAAQVPDFRTLDLNLAQNRLGQYNDRPTYTPNQVTQDAMDKMLSIGNRPTFASKYQTQIDALLDGIYNQGAFEYQLGADPTYQMYRDQYARNAARAAQDAAGSAAALTGGYGSSYGASAAAQASANELANLNDIALQLENQAYGRYRDDIAERYNRLGAFQGQDDRDYSRYRYGVGDWENDRDYLTNRYMDERDFDYGRFRDEMGDFDTDRAYWYQYLGDAANEALQQYQLEQAAKGGRGGSGGSGGKKDDKAGSGGSGGKDDTAGEEKDAKQLMQDALNAMAGRSNVTVRNGNAVDGTGAYLPAEELLALMNKYSK